MTILIDQLKTGHHIIFKTLEKARQFGIGSREGQMELLLAKSSLLAHLKTEDVRLYPALRSTAQTNRSMKLTLDSFAKDMDEISRLAIGFFDKYSNGGSGIEFARDFGRLYAMLKIRMHKEENILYRQYEQLNNRNAQGAA